MNPFINVFVDSLEAQACEVISLKDFDVSTQLPALDAFVIHWPQFLFKNSFGKFAKFKTLLIFRQFLLRLKRNGTKIIWICHDLHPHDWNAWHWRALWWPTLRVMLHTSDGIVTLSPGTCQQVSRKYSRWIRGRVDWAWHPSYPKAITSACERTRFREQLYVPASTKLIGLFGQLRSNKGINELLDVFQESNEPGINLLIAGTPIKAADAVSKAVVRAANEDSRIHAIVRKLSEDEVSGLVAACDLCVFPYKRYTHSGAMIFSLCAHRPILAPTTPFSESLADLLPEWVTLYDNELTASALLEAAKKPLPPSAPNLAPFSSRDLAIKVLEMVDDTRSS